MMSRAYSEKISFITFFPLLPIFSPMLLDYQPNDVTSVLAGPLKGRLAGLICIIHATGCTAGCVHTTGCTTGCKVYSAVTAVGSHGSCL